VADKISRQLTHKLLPVSVLTRLIGSAVFAGVDLVIRSMLLLLGQATLGSRYLYVGVQKVHRLISKDIINFIYIASLVSTVCCCNIVQRIIRPHLITV